LRQTQGNDRSTRWVVPRLSVAAVRSGDRPHDREAESGAAVGTGTGGISPAEALERVW
jgi:hypothetical protein